MRLILLLTILVSLLSCKTESTDNRVLNNNVINKIKEFNIQYEITYDYKYSFGEIDKESKFLVKVAEFDREGNEIKTEEFNRGFLKEFDKTTFCEYDKNNHLIKITEKNNKEDIIFLAMYINDNGLNTERIFYDSEGNMSGKVIYKYDKNENCIKHTSFDKMGKVDYIETSKYDKNNIEVESKTVKNDGKIKEYTVLAENKNRKLKYQTYDSSNNLLNEIILVINLATIYRNV